MADYSLSGVSSGGYESQTDQIVAAYKQTQQYRIDALNTKKYDYQEKQAFFNTLNSKLSTLISRLDTFTADDAADKFVTRSITSSNTSVMTASADSDAIVGISQINVQQLATNDILISDQMNLDDDFKLKAGTQEFVLNIGENEYTINMELDGDETNEEAMKKIAKAINSFTDDDDEEIAVTAAFIKDTSTTGRLTLTSTETGSENEISFTQTKLSKELGWSNNLKSSGDSRTEANDTSAGYRYADRNELDANLTVNGIDITRSSNSIDDLLPGVTLNLKKPQEEDELPVTLTTEIDVQAVVDLLEPLLNSYNDTLEYLNYDKDIRRSESSVSGLYSRLRGTLSEKVTGLGDGDPNYLASIGINIGSDGTVSISDKERLEEVLADDPQLVANLFTAEDSFVNKVSSALENLTGSGGLFQTRALSLGDQIDYTAERTEELQARIDAQAETLRKQYEDMLEVYLEAQNQYQLLGTSSYSY